MSGFGIREQWYAGKRLADAKKPLWRPASFLQQLSLNGSMLLVRNHDHHWLDKLATTMNEAGSGWASLSARLRSMPAGSARKLLWRTSHRWWKDSADAYPQMSALAWRYGLERPDSLLSFDKSLRRTALQLETLSWCERDVERKPIKVIDLEHQAQA